MVMRAMVLWQWVLCVLLSTAGVGLAQPAPPAVPPSAPPSAAPASQDPAIALHTTVGASDRLANLWTMRRARQKAEDAEGADDVLNQIEGVKRDRGIQRLDGLAVSLIREAEAAATAGKADVARVRLVSASRVAPGLPAIDQARARIALELQPWAVHRWLQYKVEGLGSAMADFQYRALLLADGVLIAMIIIVGVGALFLLGQLLRYGLNLYYDLGTIFPQVMRVALIAAGVLLCLLPFYFGFGPLVILFPLAMLLWPYQSARERVLVVIMVGLLGATPWMLRMGDRLTEAGTGTTQALHALALDPGDAHALRVVKQTARDAPRDWHAQAALGMAYKRLGQVPQALELLTPASELAKGEAASTVQNNLGNALFAAGRGREAEAAYERARAANPNAAQPNFNLHRLYRRMGRKEKAADALRAASAIDSEAVAEWNQDDDLSLNRYVVDMPLPANLLTRRAFADLLAPTPLATRAWVLIAGPLPELAAPIGASVTLLAFILLLSLRERMRLSWPCVRTGRAVQHYMIHGRPDAPLDDEYVAIFVHNKPADRRDRFALEARMARFSTLRRWGTRLCGLVPGLLGMVRGRPLRGAFVAALTLLLLLSLWLPDGVLLDPVNINRVGMERWLFVGLLGLIWVLSLLRAFRWIEEHD